MDRPNPRRNVHSENRYQLLDEMPFAKGSFGKVLRALDREHTDVGAVAIKIQKQTVEARADLHWHLPFTVRAHANVQSLLNAWHRKGDYCMVMQLAPLDLYRLWTHYGGLLPMAQRQHIARGLAQGIAHLHANACVHCDLSSGNVLIFTGSGGSLRPVISDFGGASTVGKDGACPLVSRGTAYIRAPECWLQANTGTKAIDLWALGAIGLMLVSGTIWGVQDAREKPTDSPVLWLRKMVWATGPMAPETWKIPFNRNRCKEHLRMALLGKDEGGFQKLELMVQCPTVVRRGICMSDVLPLCILALFCLLYTSDAADE